MREPECRTTHQAGITTQTFYDAPDKHGLPAAQRPLQNEDVAWLKFTGQGSAQNQRLLRGMRLHKPMTESALGHVESCSQPAQLTSSSSPFQSSRTVDRDDAPHSLNSPILVTGQPPRAMGTSPLAANRSS